jgi:hypothetical protein
LLALIAHEFLHVSRIRVKIVVFCAFTNSSQLRNVSVKKETYLNFLPWPDIINLKLKVGRKQEKGL